MNGGNGFVPLEIMHSLHLPAFTSAESAKIICFAVIPIEFVAKKQLQTSDPQKDTEMLQ